MKTSLLIHLAGFCLLLASAHANAASVGELAPDFEIAMQHGNVFRLSDFRGQKPVYIIFWNTWCEYCLKKIPRYEKLQQQYGDKIEIIAINTTWSDSPEEVKLTEQGHQINYPLAFDAGELVTDLYRVRSVPSEFIVDINGIIRYRDHVPEYLAAHLPDWLLPYVPSKSADALACAQ